MRVDVFPRQAAITAGQQQIISVTITNTSTVIGGYTVRLLGADPTWVQLDTDQVSLFPDEVRTINATITPPRGLAAGSRRIAVQVRELTPPEDSSITEIDLTVPAARSVQVRVDPIAVTAGKRATFSIIAENTGNTTVAGRLDGDDPEGKVAFAFEPEFVHLSPGEHAVIDMRAKARRNLTGSPAVRVLGVYLDEPSSDAFFSDPDATVPGARDEKSALANATFMQKSVLSRGALSLVGLLVAVTVFAIVLTIALSRLVGQTTADRNLALQVAAARNGGATTGTSSVAGTVRLLTTGKAVPGVSVSVFPASNTSSAIATTATDKSGAYSVGQLTAGKYKISFKGAGFVQLWYPGATTDSDATTVTLDTGQSQHGLDVRLGGVPASISGSVTGDDVSAATLYLETIPGGSGSSGGSSGSGSATQATGATHTQLPAAGGGTAPVPGNGDAIVQTVPIGSDGSFALTNVPSPSIYQLVVVKAGYATSTQQIDVSAGEDRTGVQLALRKGDGLISGTVRNATRAIGGVTITATAGQSTTSTVSTSVGKLGAFTLRSLPTPGSFTIVASKPNYTSQTLTLSLAAGQKLTGVAITLGQSSGSIHGSLSVQPSINAPPDAQTSASASGVAVTVTDGLLTVQTETESKTAGSATAAWSVGRLPLPGTYTITFTRPDLAAQTVSVSLDASGNVTQGATGPNGEVDVVMQSATSTVYGTISQPGGTNLCAGSANLGEATVSLSSGKKAYTVTSASAPASECGHYEVPDLPPGTYTLTVGAGSGTSPSSKVIELTAGQDQNVPVQLGTPAALGGSVVFVGTNSGPSGWTAFLYAANEYPATITAQATTTSGGGFSFGTVDAGRYIVAVGPTSDPNNAIVTKQVTVRPGQQVSTFKIAVPQ